MKKGFGLIAMIFYLLVFLAIGVGLVSLVTTGSRLSVIEYRYSRAFYIAEAGKNFALQHLAGYPDWSQDMGMPLSKSFAGGAFTVRTSEESANQVKLISTGVLTQEGQTYARTVQAIASIVRGQGLPHGFSYTMYAGPPSGGATLRIEGTAGIYGDFYYNGPIRLGGSAHQQDGTIYSRSLSVYGSATYASWEAAPAIDMPIWDNAPYNSILALTTREASSDLNLGSGGSLVLNGETRYYRSVNIGPGSTITGPGTICATGVPSGTGDLMIGNGYGVGSGIRFIARRNFYYMGGPSSASSIEAYAGQKVTVMNYSSVNGGSLLYSRGTGDSAVYTASNVRGNLVAPYGRVYMNGGEIRGLIYADRVFIPNTGTIRGSIVCRLTSSIGGQVQIYYDPAYLPSSLLGLGGSGDITAEAGIAVNDWQIVY